MALDNSYGLYWPDTWIVFLGKNDSTALTASTSLKQVQFGSEIIRYTSGRSLPLPHFAQVGKVGVVFDGYLFNTDQLIRELDVDPEKSLDLAYLVLLAFRKWGEGFIDRLVGNFSLVVWDADQDLFLALRDPVGVYPLFFADTPIGTFFSLSIQALLTQPEVPGTINRTVMALYLSLAWGRKEETMFQHVERIPPCHILRIHKGKREKIRYWHPVHPDGSVDWLQDASSDHFETLMEKVSRDLLNFGPAGIYLSGGLDSVTATAFTTDSAVRLKKPVPRAYSLVFPNIGEREEPVQRGVASGLNLPLFITSLKHASGEKGLLQSAIEINMKWSVPMQNFWRPAYNHLGIQAKKDGCSVIITGVGGDEWLGLNPLYAADLIGNFDLPGLYRLIVGMWHSWPFPLRDHIYNGLWKYGTRPYIARKAARILFRIAPEILRARRKNSLQRDDPAWFEPDPEIRVGISSHMDERVEESLLADRWKSFYAGELFYAVDHPMNSMDLEEEFENGRQLGIPILGFYQHQELVNYLLRFPPHLLNTGRPQKGLVREILQKRFPDLGLQKQKKIGATDNFREIVVEETPDIWKNLGGIQALSKLGIVNATKADEFFTSTISSPPPSNLPTWLIWHLIDYESWLRNSGIL